MGKGNGIRLVEGYDGGVGDDVGEDLVGVERDGAIGGKCVTRDAATGVRVLAVDDQIPVEAFAEVEQIRGCFLAAGLVVSSLEVMYTVEADDGEVQDLN